MTVPNTAEDLVNTVRQRCFIAFSLCEEILAFSLCFGCLGRSSAWSHLLCDVSRSGLRRTSGICAVCDQMSLNALGVAPRRRKSCRQCRHRLSLFVRCCGEMPEQCCPSAAEHASRHLTTANPLPSVGVILAPTPPPCVTVPCLVCLLHGSGAGKHLK